MCLNAKHATVCSSCLHLKRQINIACKVLFTNASDTIWSCISKLNLACDMFRKLEERTNYRPNWSSTGSLSTALRHDNWNINLHMRFFSSCSRQGWLGVSDVRPELWVGNKKSWKQMTALLLGNIVLGTRVLRRPWSRSSYCPLVPPRVGVSIVVIIIYWLSGIVCSQRVLPWKHMVAWWSRGQPS